MRRVYQLKTANSEQPLVSVIMPTYNHAKFIGKAIDSVLNQMYKNFELVVIDNYSDDDTEKIVDSYEDNRIIYLKFRNNGIIAASRNHGIKHSRGEYIAFLDSDDIWLPEKLEKGLRVLEGANDTAMVYARFRTVDGSTMSESILPKNGKYQSGYIFRSLYIRSFIACSSVMVKKSVLNQIGLFNTDADFVAVEDTDLWLRIAQNHCIVCTDSSPLLLYRIHPQCISRGYLKKMKRSLVLKKKYIKQAGKYLFFKSMFLTLLDIPKQELINRLKSTKISLAC